MRQRVIATEHLVTEIRNTLPATEKIGAAAGVDHE
jgi:hypothetical protein